MLNVPCFFSGNGRWWRHEVTVSQWQPASNMQSGMARRAGGDTASRAALDVAVVVGGDDATVAASSSVAAAGDGGSVTSSGGWQAS